MLMEYYLWVKALHIISIIAWMAGLLYLPRLFVYHAQAKKDSELSETLKIMERRLLRFIMNPAMMTSWLFGLLMIAANPALFENGWMHVKFLFVILLTGAHMFFARMRKIFEKDENDKDARFYRLMNEVPTLFMIIIVIMAVAEPF